MRTRGNSGGVNESAPLWSNTNTGVAFADGANVTAQLSESYDNYDMLRIYYYKSTADRNTVMVQDIDPFVLDANSAYRYTIGNSYGARNITYNNAQHTAITISQCFQLYYRALDNTQVIPIKITGLKNVKTW